MDFTIFYKDVISDEEIISLDAYDVFYAAYDNSFRTSQLIDLVKAHNIQVFYFPHYTYSCELDIDDKVKYISPTFDVSEYFSSFIDSFNVENDAKICIDITGFVKPHLLFLINFLYIKGIKRLDLLYTEAQQYVSADETKFSGFVDHIASIPGFTSQNIEPNSNNDILIIAAGYDDELISKIAKYKDCKYKYLLLGFPSIQADMYQENILQIESIRNTLGSFKIRYAPASDPFVTAQVISEIVEENPSMTNLFLSPLSTKPHSIGMMLYYLFNQVEKSINIIYPYTNKCFHGSTDEIKRRWMYTIEML